MIKVAVTGVVGSGKSTVMKLISQHYTVFDVDKINAELLEEKYVIQKLVYTFSNIIIKEGILDKKALSTLIYSDELKRKELESIMHPLIKDELFNRISSLQDKVVFVEVPLLFEVNWDKYFDFSVLVYTEVDTIVSRLKEGRNWDIEFTKKVLANQLPLSYKVSKSDYVIYNDYGNDIVSEVNKMIGWIMGQVNE